MPNDLMKCLDTCIVYTRGRFPVNPYLPEQTKHDQAELEVETIRLLC
jgi:hypothetical protein